MSDPAAGVDPVDLAARLIRHPSVTPDAGGAIGELADLLSAHGFACTRIDRGGVPNLYARRGTDGPVLGFNGHLDVVPPGDAALWSEDPFAATVRDGALWGRGACDMKSAVAAWAVAAIAAAPACPGSLVLAITGDEEGPGTDGTRAILDWMAETGERMDACIVGEPTCPSEMGEMAKIGRRGSMTAWITATGRQGHSAYPQNALNPIHAMVACLSRLTARPLDAGTEHFDPTTLQVTGFDTGNDANNVIPAACRAMVNIRFNDAHDGETLSDWLRAEAADAARETGVAFALDIRVSGESFLTLPGPLTEIVSRAVAAETGERMDACIVGEPTCPSEMGEMVKIGRRGSMTAWVTATGRQGHSAYPQHALNPIHAMVACLSRLAARPLDAGTEHFDPTTLQITGFDTGNDASNVIPAACRAMVNIRFNDAHDGETLSDWLRAEAADAARETGVAFALDIRVSGESFLTLPGPLTEIVSRAVAAETGRTPLLSTSGGTSDARFVKDHCPVVEVGLVNATMHQVDERAELAHIRQLTAIYRRIIEGVFA